MMDVITPALDCSRAILASASYLDGEIPISNAAKSYKLVAMRIT